MRKKILRFLVFHLDTWHLSFYIQKFNNIYYGLLMITSVYFLYLKNFLNNEFSFFWELFIFLQLVCHLF